MQIFSFSFFLCISYVVNAELSDAYINTKFIQYGYATDCFHFDINQLRSKIELEVQSESSLSFVDVIFYDPNKNEVFNSEGVTSAKYSHPSEENDILSEIGTYKVCITNNQKSSINVFLNLEIDEKNSENIDVASNMHRIKQKKINSNLEMKMTLENFEKITLSIDQKLTKAKRFQTRITSSEYTQRENMELLFTKVNAWGFAHTGVIIASSISQVLFIRGLLYEPLSSDRYRHRY